ncbi:MAG: phosphoribosyltransferase family protein [Evtepia sp.]
MPSLKKFLGSCLDLIFPPHCVYCDAVLDAPQPDPCPRCREKLAWIPESLPPRTGKAFSECISAAWYTGEMRGSIHRFKFSAQSSYAAAYAIVLAPRIQLYFSDAYDLLSWVPVSPATLKKRGYDQARLLADEIASRLGQAAVGTLIKSRSNVPQSTLSDATSRRTNVIGVYSVADSGLIAGKRILLIDDVITTGSTLEEAAQTLLNSGAVEVMTATFCCGKPASIPK